MITNRKAFRQICLTFESREDGGLRVFSDDVPGFLLSHRDYKAVMEDIVPALETILGEKYGVKVRVGALEKLQEDLEDCAIISPYALVGNRTFVADFEAA